MPHNTIQQKAEEFSPWFSVVNRGLQDIVVPLELA